MPTFVLVHGAWHGGWCWERVGALLRQAGSTTYAPTLSGLAERADLLTPSLGLEAHVADIVRLIERHALRDVVLVGHSYSGAVVTVAADRLPGRIARVVYLDAVVPQNGQCLFDCSSSKFRSRIEEQVRTQGDGWRIPPPSPESLGLVKDADIEWVMPRLTPHPCRSFRDPVALQGRPVARTYINCIDTRTPGAERSPQAAGIEDYHELSCGHDAMVTAPLELAQLLSRICA